MFLRVLFYILRPLQVPSYSPSSHEYVHTAAAAALQSRTFSPTPNATMTVLSHIRNPNRTMTRSCPAGYKMTTTDNPGISVSRTDT